MKVKLFILLLSGFVIATLGAINSKQEQITELEASKDKNTIGWYVQQAKLRGEREVILPAPKVEYVTEINAVDEVFSHYRIVVAEPIEDKSFVDDTHLYTWYKFRILEDLSSKKILPCPTCPLPSDVLNELLPLSSDEILVLKIGGIVFVDNIKISMIDRRFPEFAKSKKYLLFLEIDPSGQVGKLRIGPGGIFTVGDDDQLSPINNEPHPLKRFMKMSYNNALHTLREDARQRVKTQ